MTDDKKQQKTGDIPESSDEQRTPPKFDIRINEFGEIVREYDMDELNRFLDEHVDDPKLKEE